MSAVLPVPATSTPWRQSLPALGVVLLALLWLYRDTGLAMVGIWDRSETFAHAFLVPPIVLWLVWRLRHRVAELTPRPQPWTLLPMAAVAAVWMLGDLAGVNSLTQLMFTALMVLAVPAVLGLRVAYVLAFPLGFLFFMVPIGDFLLGVMMERTADFTVAAVALSGVPVYREGLNFIIPSGSWSVVEACSGVRYLIASFMVGTLFAYLNYTSTKRRLIFCAVSIALPVLANWLRAYMIVMLGHLSNNKLAVGVDHLIYGWVFFGIVILLMFMIGAHWAQPAADFSATAAAPPAAPGGHTAGGTLNPWVAAAATLALLALPQLAVRQLQHAPAGPTPVLALPDLPSTATVLPGDVAGVPAYEPTFVGPAAVASRSYAVGPRTVTVHVAFYRQQHYGHKLVSSENALLRSDATHWSRRESGHTVVAVGERRVGLRTAALLSGGVGAAARARLEVRQLYWVDGRFTTSDHWATALGLLGRLAGRGDDAAAVTFYTAGEEAEGTAQVLDSFIRTHLPAIEAGLLTVRAAR